MGLGHLPHHRRIAGAVPDRSDGSSRTAKAETNRIPRWCTVLLLGLLSLTCASESLAQKPGKGGSTPPPPAPNLGGLIFHYRDQDVWSMRPDGSQLTKVLSQAAVPPNSSGTPCFHAQDGDPVYGRWYITQVQTGTYSQATTPTGGTSTNVAHYDLFAFRSVPGNPSQFESIQLTDLFGLFRLSPSGASWSVDSNDNGATSHIHCDGRDIRSTFVTDEDGNTYYDASQSPDRTLRLPITAGAITEGWNLGEFVPYRPADPAALTPLLSPYLRSDFFEVPPLTPDGQFLVGLEGSVTLLDPATATPLFTVWDGATMGEPTRLSGSWQNNAAALSPDSTRLAIINWKNDSTGGVWILTLDGSAPPKQISQNSSKGTSYSRFQHVLWSPDSNHVLTQRVSYQSNKLTFDQLIIPAAGGSPVTTFAASPISGIRWVSSDPAP